MKKSFNELWEKTPYLRFVESRDTFNGLVQCPLCDLAGRQIYILDHITPNFVLCGECKGLSKIKVRRDVMKEIFDFWMNIGDLLMNFYKKDEKFE